MLLYLSLLIIALLYFWVKRCYSFWAKYNVTTPPVTFPFGNLSGFGYKVHSAEGFDKFYKEYKNKQPVLGMYFYFGPTMLLLDLDVIKSVLVKDFSSFHDRGFYFNKESDPLSANMLTLEGSEWRDRRVKLSPIFTTGKIKLMFDIVNSIGDKFTESVNRTIASDGTQEVNYIMANYSTDVISNVAFGIDSKCLSDPNSEFGKMRHKLFHLSKFQFMRLVIASVAPNLAKKLGIPANPREPTSFLLKTFLETLKYREETKIQRNDFINMLLKLRETLSLSDIEMAAESFIFFVGGFETSSSTLTYALYELSKNNEIQDKLRSEIVEGIRENDGQLSYDSLTKLEYLDMFVKETLRLYPVIPVLMRKCTKEFNIPGTDMIVPKDINVIVPIFSVHRDPDFYPDPLKFDPERFSSQFKDRNPMTFLAFGEGSRNCIGARFGYLQVKIALVKLLTNFKFSVCDRTPNPIEFIPSAPFISPKGGMWLNITKLVK